MHLQKHLHATHQHLKTHHRKYLLGLGSSFLIVKLFTLFVSGLGFLIQPFSSSAGWDGGTWDNNYFIDQTFWEGNPSDQDIIDAIYGNVSDTTTYYPLGIPTACNPSDISVTHLYSGVNTIPQQLSGNHIYIFNDGKYQITYTTGISANQNCTTLLGKGEISLHSSNRIQGGMLTLNGYNNIIDNIDIDGKYNMEGAEHSMNNYGIIAQWSIIHNSQIFNNLYDGIFGNVNNINNSQIFNNSSNGINGGSNSINNSQIFNNSSNGINGDVNNINNSQIFNNLYDGIFGGNITINNSQIYNNDNGIHIERNSNSIITSTQIYNNNRGILLKRHINLKLYSLAIFNNTIGIEYIIGPNEMWPHNNTYHGDFYLFGNDNNFVGTNGQDLFFMAGDSTPYNDHYIFAPDRGFGNILSNNFNISGFVTTPIDALGNYLFSGINNRSLVRGKLPFTGTKDMVYIYGEDTLKQTKPQIFDNPLIAFSVVPRGLYTRSKYVGEPLDNEGYILKATYFSGVTGANLYTKYISNDIVLSGIPSGDFEFISLSEGRLLKNGIDISQYWNGNRISYGTGSNGDVFSVQLYSSPIYSTVTTGTLYLGGMSRDFSVKTLDKYVPDQFSFTSITGTELNTLYTSNIVTLTGMSPGVFTGMSVTTGYIIKNNINIGQSGTGANGDQIILALTSSNNYSTVVSSTMSIGGITGGYSVTTKDQVVGSMNWNNDVFIDQTFWEGNPTTGDIIKALYGSGIDDKTAYTENRSGNDCNPANLGVVYINPGTGTLPQQLSGNTIYVLNAGDYITTSMQGIGFIADCSAIVGNGNTTISSSYTLRLPNAMLKYDSMKGIIIDSVEIDGVKRSGESPVSNDRGILVGANSTLNNVDIHDHSQGITMSNGRNNTINNSRIHRNNNGIYINSSTKNTISDSHIFGNTIGVVLDTYCDNSIINNSQFYNNYVGLYSVASNNNSINNSQFYNHYNYGIWMDSSSNHTISNSQFYNNSVGLYGNGSNNNTMNNSQFYNNTNGIFLASSTANIYYGALEIFGNTTNLNGTNGNDTKLMGGSRSDAIASAVGRNTGSLSITGSLSRDYITNPRNNSGEYLLSRWSTFTSLRGNKEFSTIKDITYSYGSGIFMQAQPVFYSGTELRTGGIFNPSEYIGSHVSKITGDLLGLSSNMTSLILSLSGISSAASNYSLFGDISPWRQGQEINTTTGVTLTQGNGTKKIITQIYTPNIYFATHFEKIGDVIIDEIPDQFSFTSITGTELNTLYTSNIVTLTGMSPGVFTGMSVTTGYIIKNNINIGQSGTGGNGDQIILALTSSNNHNTTVSSLLSIGGVTGQWTITTRSTPIDWNNDSFINQSFWDQNPTDQDIIGALYGSDAGDTSAYTYYRSGGNNCPTNSMSVYRIAPGVNTLPKTIPANTIYVLNSGSYVNTIQGDIFLYEYPAGVWYQIEQGILIDTCSAVIGIGDVTLYNSTGRNSMLQLKSSNIIIDNINIDGTSNGIGGTHTANGEGIISSGNNITIHGANIYNNTLGIGLYKSASNTMISDSNIYNNYNGITLNNLWYGYPHPSGGTRSDNNIFSNIQIYNNQNVGLAFYRTLRNSVNNLQIYNNNVGFYTEGSGDIINNSQIYNNGLYGFSAKQASTTIHNIQFYNNSVGINIDTDSKIRYYGNIKAFSNDTNTSVTSRYPGNPNPTFIIYQGTGGDYAYLGWASGSFTTGDLSLSWDYLTNPINTNNEYLYPWNKNPQGQIFESRSGNQYFYTYSGNVGQIGLYIPYRTKNYSYGSGIFMQIQPVFYSGTELRTGGIFNPSEYIGSHVSKITGDLLGLSSNMTSLILSLSGISSAASNYSLFGDISPWRQGQEINTTTGVTLTQGNGTKRIITQIYTPNTYFATHFEKIGDVIVDEIPDQFSFTAVTGAHINLNYLSNTVTLSGMSPGAFTGISVNRGYIIKNGINIGISGTGANGDQFYIQLPASPNYSTTVTATMTIAGVSGTYSVTTKPQLPPSNITWNNDNLIDQRFWDTNPNDQAIIEAIYGSGSYDPTPYTMTPQNQSGVWFGLSLDVVHLYPGTNTIPEYPSSYTIYVLHDGEYMITYASGVQISSNWITLMGENNVKVYSQNQIPSMITIATGNFGVNISNIEIDGEYGHSSSRNTNGIFIGRRTNSVKITHVTIKNNSYGVYSDLGDYTKITHSRIYDNQEGVYAGGLAMLIDNSLVYNNSIGVNFRNVHFSTISNSQIYNNSDGILYYYGTRNILTNSQIYNNNSEGIYFVSSNDNTISASQIYNNYNGIFVSNSLRNSYSSIKMFGNNQNFYHIIPNGWSVGITGTNLDTGGSIDISMMITPSTSGYIYGSKVLKQVLPSRIRFYGDAIADIIYPTFGIDYDKYIGQYGPVGGTFSINNNTEITNTPIVTLNSNVTGASQMRFADTMNGLSLANWMSYSSSQSYTLTGVSGTGKSIYAQYSGQYGNFYAVDIITYIDTTKPTATISPSTGARTKNPVRVTLTGFSEQLTGLNATGHLFTGNGSFVFTFSDLAGNTGATTATVNRIDTTKPTATISPSTGARTKNPVRVVLTGFSESLTGLNATGHLFTGNGSFVFTFSDLAGNTGNTTATVNWIDTIKPTVSLLTPINNANITGNINFSWTGTDTGANISGYILSLYSGESLLLQRANTNTSLQISSGELAHGTYTWKVIAIDNVGNTGNSTSLTLIYGDRILIYPEEYLALMNLYTSTDGDHWNQRTNRLDTGAIPQGWYGITIVNGHVTHIQLSENNLSGRIDGVNFNNFVALEEISFANNFIKGGLPQSLIRLLRNRPSLQFNISNNVGLIGRAESQLLTGSLGTLLVTGNQYIGYSGGTRDGTFLPPQAATGAKRAVAGELGLERKTPLLTIEAGSSTTDLIPYTGTFTVSVKVESGSIGQILALSRSNYNDGTIWENNSPDPTCTLDNNLFCTFKTDHLSLFALSQAPLCDYVSDVPQAECNALIDLYHSTNGSGWFDTGGWLVNTGVCNRYGVVCDANHVTEVNLGTCSLSGAIPSSIDNLSYLKSLQLFDNTITTLPPEIGNLTGLTSLDLSNLNLSAFPFWITNLLNLEALSLGGATIQSIPPEISNLTKLYWFHIAGNKITSLPYQLFDLTGLQYLYLGENQLSVLPSAVGNLTNLKILNLFDNLLTTLPYTIGYLTGLESLHLGSNNITALPVGLFPLLKQEGKTSTDVVGRLHGYRISNQLLTGTSLSGSILVSGNIHVGYSGGTRDGTFLPPQAATGAKRAVAGELGLERKTPLLTIEAGSPTTDLIPYTGTFTLSIKVESGTIGQILALSRSNYNDGDTWAPNSPDLTCTLDSDNMCTFRTDHLSLFTLSQVPLCDYVSDVSTGECEALVDLYHSTNGSGWFNTGGWLVNTGVCNRSGVACDANRIVGLHLYFNNLSGDIPPSFGNLTGLRDILFYNNSLSSLPDSIGNLTQLNTLYLGTNTISTLPSSIGYLTGLTVLSLSYNKLTSIPSEIGNLTQLLALQFQDNYGLTAIPASLIRLLKSNTSLVPNFNIKRTPANRFHRDTLITGTSLSGSLLINENEYIGYSGGTWDGTFLPPQLATGSKIAVAGEVGLVGTPLLTIEAGSPTTDLIPYTGTFTLSVKVASGGSGQSLSISRSNYNDGNTWAPNIPDSTCTLDSDNMCTFRTDHLSLFSFAIASISPPTSSSQGGGNIFHKDFCPSGDFSPSYYDGSCGIFPTYWPKTDPVVKTLYSIKNIPFCFITGTSYSQEINDAFQWAYNSELEMSCPIEKAQLDAPLLRYQVARFLTIFAVKTLGRTPNTNIVGCNSFSDTSSLSKQDKEYIKIACQLGILGLQSDGKKANKTFSPYGKITRAQLGTILSRLLYGNTYNTSSSSQRYIPHLQKLNKEGIIKDISNPKFQEPKKYFMLMIWRIYKSRFSSK